MTAHVISGLYPTCAGTFFQSVGKVLQFSVAACQCRLQSASCIRRKWRWAGQEECLGWCSTRYWTTQGTEFIQDECLLMTEWGLLVVCWVLLRSLRSGVAFRWLKRYPSQCWFLLGFCCCFLGFFALYNRIEVGGLISFTLVINRIIKLIFFIIHHQKSATHFYIHENMTAEVKITMILTNVQ